MSDEKQSLLLEEGNIQDESDLERTPTNFMLDLNKVTGTLLYVESH